MNVLKNISGFAFKAIVLSTVFLQTHIPLVFAQAGRQIERAEIKLEYFRFDQNQHTDIPEMVYWLAILGVVFVISVFVYWRYQKRKNTEELFRQIAHRKSNMKFEMALNKRKLSPKTKQFLQELCNSSDPEILSKAIETPEVFETQVSKYKERSLDVQSNNVEIFSLRHQLGFKVSNSKVPFVTTRSLVKKFKIECRIPHPEKKITFSTRIVQVTENYFAIRPPTIRKKIVNFGPFSSLICSVKHHNEMIFEFESPILKQNLEKRGIVLLGHTDRISQCFIRHSERIELKMST